MRVKLDVRIVNDDGTAFDFKSDYSIATMFGLDGALDDFGSETLRFLQDSEPRRFYSTRREAKRFGRKVKVDA